MNLTLRFLGLELYWSFGRQDATVEADSYQLTTTDVSFGFAPDPLVDYYWTDDE